MLINEIELGQRIYLCFNKGDILDSNFEFVSQIDDIVSQKEFIVSTPFHKSTVVNFNENDKLKAWFAHDNGLYVFDCEVSEIIYEKESTFYKLLITSNINRLQRRAYYRIDINVPLIYGITKDGKQIMGRGTAKDISGGGLKFIADESIEEGDDISIYLRMDSKFEINTEARVNRCVKNNERKYEVSVLFNSLDFKQREDLIKYIFDIQRGNLKKK